MNHSLNGQPHSHSLLLINTNISADHYSYLRICHHDFTGICFTGIFGNLSIISTYIEIINNSSINILSSYIDTQGHKARPDDEDHMLWLGDFNCHHESWEPHTNTHLYSSPDRIDPFLDVLFESGMMMALP
ncbi:hypothetical protein FIBSPDRAFT_1004725, partial [Athelia psychrophila]